MATFLPTRFGKYLLLEKVATGGMAQLYRAKITGVQGFEKFVAIKQILPHLAEEKELIGSFIDEAKLAALLNHQNVVQIYDFGNEGNTYFITMEYLFGKDLGMIARKIKEKDLPLSLEHSLYIMSRICSGLDYAHKLKDFQGKPLNIIHRDVSPQNVIITYEGDVKLVDFGIAKARSQSTITQVGMIKGKVAYMSPEQAAGKVIDHRSDIFPCGILLYEMISGKRMFIGETMQILAKIRLAEFEAPEIAIPGLPPKLYQILHSALAKEPDERYQSCGEMLADVEESMFELSLRPTARGLAQYMKDLFREEIANEEQVLSEAAQVLKTDEVRPSTDTKPAGRTAAGEEPVPAMVKEASKKRKSRRAIYGGIAAVLIVIIACVIAFWPRNKVPTTAGKIEAAKSDQPSQDTAGKVTPDDAVKSPEKSGSLERARSLITEASENLEKNPGKAKTLLLEALKLDPDNIQANSDLGRAYIKLGDNRKAIETYDRVARLDPKFPNSYFNLGYIYNEQKDYAKAEEMYSRAVQLAPAFLDEALFNLGMVQEKQGKKKQAIDNIERALTVNPGNQRARRFLKNLKGES